MIFNSLTFVVFFLAVLGVYRFLRHWPTQKHWLLIASYVFYGAWSPPFVLLLAGSTLIDWLLARQIAKTEALSRRKALLTLSILSNLGILSYFKYGRFLLENFQSALSVVGIDYAPPAASIILPVGISFYTFQSMSYTLDVYRRRLDSNWSLSDFALYVSFFPQLVAGPIVRAEQFLPQCLAPRRATPDQLGWGLSLLVIGVFCKSVLADSLLAPVADATFASDATTSGWDAWAGVLAFSGQIYYDFGGYSLCAIGAALCLGFTLPENFMRPYAAIGFSDFWRRWHISLSTWLRDYLYIPLGGNRSPQWRTAINLMLTMLIGGLWHGASWLFVMWGGLHGIYLVLERALRHFWRKHHLPLPRRLIPVIALATFFVVSLTWIPFRATDLASAQRVFESLFSTAHLSSSVDSSSALALLVIALTLAWQFQQRNLAFKDWFYGHSTFLKSVIIGACLSATYLTAGGDQRAFIYFQF